LNFESWNLLPRQVLLPVFYRRTSLYLLKLP
jgi:hypothetical protein